MVVSDGDELLVHHGLETVGSKEFFFINGPWSIIFVKAFLIGWDVLVNFNVGDINFVKFAITAFFDPSNWSSHDKIDKIDVEEAKHSSSWSGGSNAAWADVLWPVVITDERWSFGLKWDKVFVALLKLWVCGHPISKRKNKKWSILKLS
jgi:hypothetical protein